MEQSLRPSFQIPAIETKSKDEIRNFQNLLLRNTIKYLTKHSTFYKNHFALNNINPEEIQFIEDLCQIPPISKSALQKHNLDFLCVPQSKIIDYVTTSGTTSEPVTFALTNKDLNRLAYNEGISLVCASGKPSDVYQLTTTMDRRFMAGLAYFLGIRALDCGVIRVGSGIPQLQIDTIQRIKPNTLIAVPTFIIKLIEYAESINFDLNQSGVEKIVCIGESIRDHNFQENALHKKITAHWNVKLYSTYASTEMSTAYTECVEQCGGHEHPELIISELLDENDQVITSPNTPGELCITTLGVEGMPLLRFKTGDIVQFEESSCACGRNTKRISPVIGRKNQMIKYKGTTLYPPSIFDALNELTEIANYVVILKRNHLETDELLIKIALKIDAIEQIVIDKTKQLLQAKIRVKPGVQIVDNQEIVALQKNKTSRKEQRFIDLR